MLVNEEIFGQAPNLFEQLDIAMQKFRYSSNNALQQIFGVTSPSGEYMHAGVNLASGTLQSVDTQNYTYQQSSIPVITPIAQTSINLIDQIGANMFGIFSPNLFGGQNNLSNFILLMLLMNMGRSDE